MDDLISRAEAIRVASGYCHLSNIPDELAKLPSVNPKPCEDAISRQDALDAFGLSEKTRKYGGDHSGYDTRMLYEIQRELENLPSVTPAPKMGRWSDVEFMSGKLPQCSECGYTAGFTYNFCPDCGAKMEGVEE